MRRIEAVIDGPFRHGLEHGMPRDHYREACGLNPSSIKQPSPKHIKYAYENQGDTTDATLIGTATHTLVWEPDVFESTVVAYEGRRAGKDWKAFQDEHADSLILRQDDYDRVLAIGMAVANDIVVRDLAKDGEAELAVFTEEHGLQCRGLADWFTGDIVCDLKVVSSIDDRSFWGAVSRYGWDISMSCYQRWLERENGTPIKAVKFICVESKPPHDVVVRNIPPGVLDAAWLRASRSIVAVRNAIETGVWHGIARGQEQELFVPSYAMDEMEIIWEGDA